MVVRLSPQSLRLQAEVVYAQKLKPLHRGVQRLFQQRNTPKRNAQGLGTVATTSVLAVVSLDLGHSKLQVGQCRIDLAKIA